jgi:hypothetical protein
VLSGHLTVEKRDTGERRILKPGQALAETVETTHRGFTTDEPVELIVFYAGRSGLPLTINQEWFSKSIAGPVYLPGSQPLPASRGKRRDRSSIIPTLRFPFVFPLDFLFVVLDIESNLGKKIKKIW